MSSLRGNCWCFWQQTGWDQGKGGVRWGGWVREILDGDRDGQELAGKEGEEEANKSRASSVKEN